MKSRALVAGGAAVLALAVLYRETAAALAHVWLTNEDYSHGFLIVALCAYFVWERRHRFKATPVEPSAYGLLVVLASLLLLAGGQFGAELFLTRISIVGTIAGSILFLFGRRHLRIAALPIFFSFFAIPVPAIVFNQIAFPLQLLASRAAELSLNVLGIPVFREGNVIMLSTTTLEVAEACSGIRSLMALMAFGIAYGYFTERRLAARLILAVATIPIAVVANACRVAGTGIAAQFIGAAAAEGFLHAFAGWSMFLVAVFLLFALQRSLGPLWRRDAPAVALS